MSEQDWLVLADRHCDGTLTAEESTRLNDLLRDNPELQLQFLERVTVHARLQWEFGPSIGSVPLSRPEVRPIISARPARWRMLTGLAAMLLLCLGLTFAFTTRSPAAPMAVLKNAAVPRWTGNAPQPGDALPAGRLKLDGGVAEIEFGCGAVALLEGPAELELVSATQAFLHSGQMVLRVPHDHGGFKLETLAARLLDQGTEFGVKVERGETVLQVYEGAVVAELKGTRANEERVEGGQAVLLTDASEKVPFFPERFVRYLPGPDDPKGRGVYPYNNSIFDTVHIVPAPGKVTIDGDLSDWDLSGRFRTACEPPYRDAYYLEGAMMYDEQFLYVGAHVGDPHPMRSAISPHERRDLYGQGGGIALRISTDRQMGWPVRGEDAAMRKGRPAGPDDVNDKLAFVMLWYYRPEQEACLQIRHGMDFHGAAVNPPGYRGAYKVDADGQGYTLEYAIPWSLLNAANDPPRGDDVLGAAWLAHWSDADGLKWQGQLIDMLNPAEHAWNFQQAATWGKAVYHREGRLPPGTVGPTR
jgi:hypothetical protein